MKIEISESKDLLTYLEKGILDHSIDKQDKVIALLNSLIDDRKGSKPQNLQE